MTLVTKPRKACTVNPLKMSQPIGAALAFLGLDQCLPVLHGSQGCTSFGLVLFVRHFRESIPMQTTAMNEVTTILGGEESIEQALLTIYDKARPRIIGLATTGLTETKGEDIEGVIRLFRRKHPEMNHVAIVPVATPDFSGSLQDGFGKAVTALVRELAEGESTLLSGRVNVLAGASLTPADVEEIRELIEAFGLVPTILPDLSGSLDGHVPDTFSPTTLGGTPLARIRAMGSAEHTIAVGRGMQPAADVLCQRNGVPYTVFEHLSGLEQVDRLVALLHEISMEDVPPRVRRQRSRLEDAMLDGHFHFAGRRIAIGAEADLLAALADLFAGMGATVACAVAPATAPNLETLPADTVIVGDLEDLEAAARGCDLLVTHSHGRQAAERLDIPLMRMGIPNFDRLGAAHQLNVGYRGATRLIFDAANLLLAHRPEPVPGSVPGGGA